MVKSAVLLRAVGEARDVELKAPLVEIGRELTLAME
jgi:hypothetical protein